MSAHPPESLRRPVFAWSCALHCSAKDLSCFDTYEWIAKGFCRGGARDPP